MPNNKTSQRREPIILWLLTIAMLTAPLLLYWHAMAALFILELIGICLLLGVFWQQNTTQGLSKLALSTLLLIAALPFIYLIPVPESFWLSLPGREAYQESLRFLQDNHYQPWLSLSLVPQKTLHAAIALIPLLAILLATASLSEKKQIQLSYILLTIACIQAGLGLIQYANPETDWAHLGRNVKGSAHGTYLNRDHFSMLMHASLPIAIGLLTRHIGNRKSHKHHNAIAGLSLNALNATLIFSFVTFMILLGGIFSNSRAGVALTILGLVLSTLMFARHIGGKRSVGIAATLTTIGVGIAIGIGLIPILNRFIVKSPVEDLRWTLFEEAIRGIKIFSPLGSGPGTFQDIYRTIQPVELLQFMNHVHNDYLELVFETGFAGILILLLIFLSVAQGWLNVYSYSWHTYRFVKVACGISLMLISLHALVDFNMHSPANAVFTAIIAGLFLSRIRT